MGLHTFTMTAARLGRYKGQIIGSAEVVEVLSKQGRQVRMPKNQSDTYVFRRFLPYGATSTSGNTQNRFFQDGTGDRGATVVQAHATQEGVTVPPETITPVDGSCTLQQYSCLFGFTDKTFDLYEDDIPKEMIKQVGQRVALVNEMVVYGVLRSCTNVYYGGTGTTIATVNDKFTLNRVRQIVMNLQANHGKMVTRVLKASQDYGTSPVAPGYFVYCHTDLESDIREMAGFIACEKYASVKPMPNEVGAVERFRFITSPDLPSIQDGGAAIGTTGCYSTSGTSIDVYPVIVCAEDAWSQLAVRGMDALDPTYLAPGNKDKSDPHGQRGYAGTIWYKQSMIENHGWMAVLYVGRTALA